MLITIVGKWKDGKGHTIQTIKETSSQVSLYGNISYKKFIIYIYIYTPNYWVLRYMKQNKKPIKNYRENL
jgi:hypothetical protein